MKKVVVVPHTHWDREWYLSFDEFRFHLVEALDRVLSLLEAHPHYKFTLDGQVIPLLDYLEVKPENEAVLRKYVAEGRLLIGPWYVQPDEFLVSGESLIRNLLYGTRISREFGNVMLEGYVPDAFGHIAQLPQIFQGFAINSAYVMRGADSACAKANGPDFVWRAPDGSAVLCHVMETGYCNADQLSADPKKVPPPVVSLIEAGLLKPQSNPLLGFLQELSRRSRTEGILLMNGCDHRGPQEDLPEVVDELNVRFPHFMFMIGTLNDYTRLLEQTRDTLPEVRGEFRTSTRHPILAGVLSTRVYLKRANHRVETLLLKYAEPLSALARVLGGKELKHFLDLAWKTLLENHAHDSICGTGIDCVHREMECRFLRAEAIGKKIVHASLLALAQKYIVGGDVVSVFVFNPCPWERLDEVSADIPAEAVKGALLDHEGREIPFVVKGKSLVSERVLGGVIHHEKATITFPAALPPFGFATFRIIPRQPQKKAESLFIDDYTLENEFYRVAIREDGAFDLLDKITGVTYRGLNFLEDSGDAGDEYNFSPPAEQNVITSIGLRGEIERAEDVPWKGSIRVKLRLVVPRKIDTHRKSRSKETVELPIVFTVSLKRGIRRVEIEAQVENRARDHRLRVAFPTGIATESSIADDAFWVIERPTRPSPGEDGIEVPPVTHPQKAFVAVENEGKGFAILNRGLPEYEVTPDGTIYLTLLRCVGWLSRDDLITRRGHAGPPYETPEAQCLGMHRFEYAIYTYSGTWENSGVIQAAQEYSAPPVAIALRGVLKPCYDKIFHVKPNALVLSAVKPPEEGDGLVVRVYNPTRKEVMAELETAFPIGEAKEIRLDESSLAAIVPASSHLLRFPVRSGEIKTLRISIRK